MSDKEKRDSLASLAKDMLAYATRADVDPHEARREYLRRLRDLRKTWGIKEQWSRAKAEKETA